MAYDYTANNEDNTTEAIHGLDIFTKNWCMNCEATKCAKEPVFRCSICLFNQNRYKCLIKEFAVKNKHEYPMNKFGSMLR